MGNEIYQKGKAAVIVQSTKKQKDVNDFKATDFTQFQQDLVIIYKYFVLLYKELF